MSQITVDIIGFKAFKGVIDGKTMNSGSVFSVVRFDERYNKTESSGLNWKMGHSVEEWKVQDADLVFSLAAAKPSMQKPVTVILEIDRVTNGKETTELVMGLRLVNEAKKAA